MTMPHWIENINKETEITEKKSNGNSGVLKF